LNPMILIPKGTINPERYWDLTLYLLGLRLNDLNVFISSGV
jgi:hypothetical protein